MTAEALNSREEVAVPLDSPRIDPVAEVSREDDPLIAPVALPLAVAATVMDDDPFPAAIPCIDPSVAMDTSEDPPRSVCP